MASNRLKGRSTLFVNIPVGEQAGKLSTKDTKQPGQKPARLTKNDCILLQDILVRAAAGGDATLAVDAESLLPLLVGAVAAAPLGQRQGRKWLALAWPDGTAEQHLGTASAARRLGYSPQTVANALSRGKGRAQFPYRDANGNPAFVTVEKLAR